MYSDCFTAATTAVALQAGSAISELRNAVDTLIIVANDKLLEIIPPNTPLERAFGVADDILRQVYNVYTLHYSAHYVIHYMM
jgi:cell division GTPase FtsZ